MTDLPALFERSADAVKLHEALMLTAVGGTVTYFQLSDALGKPVSSCSGPLRTARRIAQNEDKTVFSCVRSVGLKRLDNEGVVDLASTQTGHVHRHAHRVGKRLGTVDLLQLKERFQQKAIAMASVLTVVADLTRASSVTRVSKAAMGRASELPIKETLRALGFSND